MLSTLMLSAGFLLLGIVLGFATGWITGAGRARAELAAERAHRDADAEKLAWTAQAEEHLREAFESLAARSLQGNAEAFARQTREQLDSVLKQVRGDWSAQKEQFANLVQPVEKSLKTLDEQVRQMEQRREGAYKAVEQHLADLKIAHRELRDETGHLRSALTVSSTARGQWGELQLRRIVEMTGMVNHVDFDLQQQSGSTRPDMLIRLPNQGILPVDAKTSLQDYLRAMEASGDAERQQALKAHTAAMKNHVRALGNKEYWRQFDRTPEVVVMFVPNESCLSAAFEQDPQLMEYGLEQQVLLATPVTLYGLLKAVAFGWQQYAVAENARLIAREGKDLCDRLSVFLEHLQGVGKGLRGAVAAYNDAVGSADSRLLPVARRLRELGATSREATELVPLDAQPRAPAASSDMKSGV